MARKTIATTVLELVHERGPLTLTEVADALVAAGATRARNPVAAVLSVVSHDERFLTTSDGRVFSALDQLGGALLSHRLDAFEAAHEVLVLHEADRLIELAIAGGMPLPSGGNVLAMSMDRRFDVPWDEDEYDYGSRPVVINPQVGACRELDEDATWQYIVQNRWSRVLSGPRGWMRGAECGEIIALRPSNGTLEVMSLPSANADSATVGPAIETLRVLAARLGGNGAVGAATLSIPELLAVVAIEAPHLLSQPLPPIGELIAAAFPEAAGQPGTDAALGPMVGVERLATPVGNDLYYDHMGMKMTATEAKARFLALLERVAAGEEVEITKHGRSIAKLVPSTGPHALRGSLAGIAMSVDPDDDLLTTNEKWDAA